MADITPTTKIIPSYPFSHNLCLERLEQILKEVEMAGFFTFDQKIKAFHFLTQLEENTAFLIDGCLSQAKLDSLKRKYKLFTRKYPAIEWAK